MTWSSRATSARPYLLVVLAAGARTGTAVFLHLRLVLLAEALALLLLLPLVRAVRLVVHRRVARERPPPRHRRRRAPRPRTRPPAPPLREGAAAPEGRPRRHAQVVALLPLGVAP